MFAELPLLSVLIWLPILGGVVAIMLGDQRDLLKPFALGIAAVTMLLSFGLYTGFDSNTHQMQFVEKLPWIETFNIFYHLGVDGFSMPLIILTTISTLLVVVAAWEVIQHRPSQYLAAFLIMEGLMIAVFSALDAVLFPLVGFDETGGRLGMGGGFYDRTFAFSRIRPCMAPKLVGLAHDFQRVEQLPIEPWDVPLHGVVTDKRCYRFRP